MTRCNPTIYHLNVQIESSAFMFDNHTVSFAKLWRNSLKDHFNLIIGGLVSSTTRVVAYIALFLSVDTFNFLFFIVSCFGASLDVMYAMQKTGWALFLSYKLTCTPDRWRLYYNIFKMKILTCCFPFFRVGLLQDSTQLGHTWSAGYSLDIENSG